MTYWTEYLDEVEQQIRLDGFMTNAMRRNLEMIRDFSQDDRDLLRVNSLISRFHEPYSRLTVRPLRPAFEHFAGAA